MFGILWEYTYSVHSLPHKRVQKNHHYEVYLLLDNIMR